MASLLFLWYFGVYSIRGIGVKLEFEITKAKCLLVIHYDCAALYFKNFFNEAFASANCALRFSSTALRIAFQFAWNCGRKCGRVDGKEEVVYAAR